MAKKKKDRKPDDRTRIATNPKARRLYEVLETYEAGMVLTGSEVKSLRNGKASLTEAFAVVQDEEVWLIGMHIPPYPQAGYAQHEPTRKRKLLLHKDEIRRLIGKTTEKGLTLIPLTCYFREGKAKLEIALAKGKRVHEKRRDLKEKEAQREIDRALRRR